MHMKRIYLCSIRVLAVLMSVVILLTVFTGAISAAPGETVSVSGAARPLATAVSRWSDTDYFKTGSLDLTAATVNKAAPVTDSDGAVVLTQNSILSIPVEIKASGRYIAALEYAPIDARVTDAALSVHMDEVQNSAALPLLWCDASDDYLQDRYGNDLLPEQASVTEFIINPLLDTQSSVGKQTLVFTLEAGKHVLQICPQEQGMRVRAAYLVAEPETVSYDTYIAGQSAPTADTQLITIEAERYAVKTDSFIRGSSVRNPALSPYNTYTRRINVIDANSWSSSGQKIAWEFDAEQDGLYHIALCYAQSAAAGKPSYRRIEIDGRLLFDGLDAVAFPQTNGSKYSNLVLSNAQGEPYCFALEKGRHVISMTATLGDAQESYRRILDIMQQINDVAAEIRSVTGGVTDMNRTWDMEVYFPNVITQLNSCIDGIDSIYAVLKGDSKRSPAYANDLLYAADILRGLIDKPQILPNKITLLAEGDQSVNKHLGNMLTALVNQPVSLDRIYVYGEGQELPAANVSFFTRLAEGIKSFFYSFTPSASQSDYAAEANKDNKELSVWINRPMQYVQVLQQIVDADYNGKYGTNIQLSVMRDEQKLILSNAAGTNPDIALGVNYYTPYDFAIRGAVKNLLEYDDFLTFYNDNYNLESLTPMCFQDGVYGAAETVDFQVLFYRRDILESLALDVPDTWDDVKRIMPVLLQNSLNFSTPIATQGGFKTYNTTSPFLFQHGGAYLAGDGASAALKSDETYEGLTAMTELYSIYGTQASVANFYNSFRFGQTPIGVGGFSTYLQMRVAAPELTGKWGIAPVPGEKQEDGSVWRYQMANSTACMIFENTEKGDEAWRFMRWWLSEEVQTRFSYLLESTLGPEYRWNTANLKSFTQLPYPKEDRETILTQLLQQKEVVRHPANYMLEREVSNIWNNAVVNGERLTEATDKAQLNTDREIMRKLEEFGFIDSNGDLLIEYNTEPIERLRALLEKGGA